MGQPLWGSWGSWGGDQGCSAEQEAGIPPPLAQENCHMLPVHPWGVQLIQGLLSNVTVQLLAPVQCFNHSQ